MKSNKWIEEAGSVDTNLFPMLSDNRTMVVFEGGRGSGKTFWVKQYLENYEKAKQEKKKTKLHKDKKQFEVREKKVLLHRKGFNGAGK